MLFVFQVDTGRMMKFEMSFALESVQNLKVHVEQACKIPADRQVLLISGGEHLDPNSRVCSYPAGTDTNPIFLFSKAIIESSTPPSASIEYGAADYDLAAKVKECSELPPSYQTVMKRTQLAQTIYEVAKEQIRICERLVHEQHLQHQGWSAVIANLEDLGADLKHRVGLYQIAFHDYMTDRESYLKFLNCFKDDLEMLQRIPVLPALLESAPVKVPEEEEEDEEEENASSAEKILVKPETLLDWISERDDFLDHLYEYCSSGLDQMDEKLFSRLQSDIEETLKNVDNPQYKTVQGLGDRLSGLEELMRQARLLVQEQMDIAHSFLKNKNRAANLQEPSILPDLCASHLQQLGILMKNHNQLRDITRRVTKAKDELSFNLFHRLKWVVFMENHLLELDNRLVFSFENLVSLQRQLDILQQVHVAPATYLAAVVEVVRRRRFSQSFLVWASDLACHLLTIYNEELTRRKEFQSTFDGHFLSSLFAGMDDLPPNFATQAPSIFDSALPKLCEEDIERLKSELPDLAENLTMPNITAITNFFLLRSIKDDDKMGLEENVGVDEKLMEAVTKAGVASNMDQNMLKAIEGEPQTTTAHGLPHLKDLDKGCESETDTEEFEKVSQSPFELNFDKGVVPISGRPGTQDAATLTEVGERTNTLPPKKPPRTFQKSQQQQQQQQDESVVLLQRTLSISGSNTESFTNIKNTSLESIDELSSLRNFGSNTESCFNSHYQQQQISATTTNIRTTKSLSPHTPQSPKDLIQVVESPNSCSSLGHQHADFVNDEFYIDESLPSSLSIETGHTSQGEFLKQLDNANNVVALLQENLQISRTDHDRVKAQYIKLVYLVRLTLEQLKNEFLEIKNQLKTDKSLLEQHCESLGSSWENIIIERDSKEKELIERITTDHELEISDFRKIAQGKNEEIKALKEFNSNLETRLNKLNEENLEVKFELEQSRLETRSKIADLEGQLDELNSEKERALKELTDRLKVEHRGEIENIRARFKLMTMERSPSESSLEKIESNVNEGILRQMTVNFELEKEMAVSDAIAKEEEKWQKNLEEKICELQLKFKQENELLIEEITRQINDDKDKQIDILREQNKNLSLECLKHKSTIQQLAECEVEREISQSGDLLGRIEVLEREKKDVECELEKLRREKSTEMSTSVSICEGKMDASTSPVKQHRRKDTPPRTGKLCIESCRVGEFVLVLWDEHHQNFKILQESSNMYFLHSDCFQVLGLEVNDGVPNKIYCYAEVVEKEYCHAKKPVNRFKVPKGTRFWRVRVKALLGKEQTPQSSMSQSQTVTTSDIIVETTTTTTTSLPSTPTKAHSLNWEPSIPEEKGGESGFSDVDDVEKGKEVTENFEEETTNIEITKSIDRSRVCIVS